MSDIPNPTQEVSLLTQDGTELKYVTIGADKILKTVAQGEAAAGVAPATYPIYMAGIDGSGLKRGIKTDSNGRIEMIMPISASAVNIPIQLGLEKPFTAINNYEWQEILEYTVPTGYDFSCVIFDTFSAVANEKARAIYKAAMGAYNTATGVFTDGEAWTLPKFAAKMYIYVTTAIGSAGNDDITITYTNQSGATGRTGTVTIPKSSLVGTRLEVNLQAGDHGFIDVTAVAHTQTGQAGAFNIEGNLGLFYTILSTPNVGYILPAPPLGSIVVPQGGKIYLQYQANSAGPNIRRINLTGTLVPR